MRVSILSLDDPWGRSHGGTQRTRSFCEAFRDLGHDVVCVYAAGPTHRSDDVYEGVLRVPVPVRPVGERPLPQVVKRVKKSLLPLPTVSGSGSRAFSNVIRARGPFDLMLVQQLRTAQYFSGASEAKAWFDQVDLWSAFARSESRRRQGLPRLTSLLQARSFGLSERRYAAGAAIVTAAGYTDAQTLERISNRSVSWLPNAAADLVVGASLAEPRKLVAGLLANFGYWPNREAYRTLCAAWAPRLVEAGWSVVVAGHESSRLPRVRGVELIGPVAEPSKFYEQVTATLAPIRLGGGIKVKVLESLAARRPVIASAMALEGFSPQVRRLTTAVDIDDPDFRFLREGPPRLDEQDWASAMELFSKTRFRQNVADRLAPLD